MQTLIFAGIFPNIEILTFRYIFPNPPIAMFIILPLLCSYHKTNLNKNGFNNEEQICNCANSNEKNIQMYEKSNYYSTNSTAYQDA